jgi:hypothetical protein
MVIELSKVRTATQESEVKISAEYGWRLGLHPEPDVK